MSDEKGGVMAKAEDIVSQYQTTRIRLLGVAYKRLVFIGIPRFVIGYTFHTACVFANLFDRHLTHSLIYSLGYSN